VAHRDPLADLEPLVRRVYGYVAYRIGSGPDSEDVTSECFERAVRYRSSYDPARGAPATWLIGIARRCVDDWLGSRRELAPDSEIDGVAHASVEELVLDRVTLERALSRLAPRDRELVALRYGADLSARRIAELTESTVNATEVALHRAVTRLRHELERQER
jgi:RNA polymerase sigma-70 factor (ECF subfamily)